jgi:hypothetical protein
VHSALGDVGQVASNTAELATRRGTLWFEPIADAKFVRRCFDPERARSRVVERQRPAPIDERSMFQRGDAMDAARMPNVKMGRDSKEHVSRIVNNDLDHILDGLIHTIDRFPAVLPAVPLVVDLGEPEPASD